MENKEARELFFSLRNILERDAFDITENGKYATCRECEEITFNGAVYKHKTNCVIKKLQETIILLLED